MKKWQLVSTSLLISTLLVSNVIITHQYEVDTRNLEKQITKKNELIESNKIEYDYILSKKNTIILDQTKKINNQNKTIKVKSSEIYRLKQQLNKATTRNESPSQQLKMNVTAYTSNCVGCSGLTFTGNDVRNTVYYQGYHVVAADLNVIPLYSIIEIQTKTEKIEAVVIDKGGAIKGHLLDLLVSDYETAIQFGRQKAKVTILRKGK